MLARKWRHWTLIHFGWGCECAAAVRTAWRFSKCQTKSHHLAQQFQSCQERKKHVSTKILHTNVCSSITYNRQMRAASNMHPLESGELELSPFQGEGSTMKGMTCGGLFSGGWGGRGTSSWLLLSESHWVLLGWSPYDSLGKRFSETHMEKRVIFICVELN